MCARKCSRWLWAPVVLIGCSGELRQASEAPAARERPEPTTCDDFEAMSPSTYGNKVKNLLTGRALSDHELQSLHADPSSFQNWVRGWLARPEVDEKLLQFFTDAFQQTGFTDSQWVDQYGADVLQMGHLQDGRIVKDLMLRNIEESFARTMLHHVREGKSFTEAATTQSFMMTTAMVFALAFQDDHMVDDAREVRYRNYGKRMDRLVFSRTEVPLSESTDPAHSNFMRFTVEQLPRCAPSEMSVRGDFRVRFFKFVFGYLHVYRDGTCTQNYRVPPLLGEGAFSDWRMVTVRKPKDGEPSTSFFDLDALKETTELVLHTPRVGFFTTPAFFSLWQTNDANQARVTMNQTLITAFGESFDGEDVTFAALEDALDDRHASPGTACYGCHQTLDPMRQFFRHDYTIHYGEQRNAEQRAIATEFAFGGVNESGGDIYDLGRIIATHPRFAPAWIQKLCFWANSGACPENSEAFAQVVDAFRASDYDFFEGLASLLSSPLVTGAECIEGSSADLPGVARQSHLCATLSARSGVEDACGRNEIRNRDRSPLQRDLNQVAGIIPADSFARGSEEPIVVSDPNMFMSAAAEHGCKRVADVVVAEGGDSSDTDPAHTIRLWVAEVMGLPESDERHEPIYEVLMDHVDDVRERGGSELEALRSVFVLACDAPTTSGVGL